MKKFLFTLILVFHSTVVDHAYSVESVITSLIPLNPQDVRVIYLPHDGSDINHFPDRWMITWYQEAK